MSKSSYKTKLQNILRHYVIVIQKRVDKYILIIYKYIYIYIHTNNFMYNINN